MQDLLQDLSSTLDTDSSGEESADENDKKQDLEDEDDQAEQAKLPQYASRFKVGVSCVWQVMEIFLSWFPPEQNMSD